MARTKSAGATKGRDEHERGGGDLLEGSRRPTRAELLGDEHAEWQEESGGGANAAPGEMTPDELVEAEVFEEGAVDHTSAQEADEAIQDVLSDYVGDAVDEGRKIAGMVAVVSDADWDTAGQNHYGDRWEDRRDRINGFVDRDRRVFIHKDRGNPGTMVHEACHKYSSPDLRGISQPLNEGVTEYFTRKVCEASDIDIARRRNYQQNYECVCELVEMVGESTVASAYFDGNLGGLRRAFSAQRNRSQGRDSFVTRMMGQADYFRFVELTSSNDWDEAAEYCK